MAELFIKILNVSISACWLILAVLCLRFALKKVPKWVRVLLWGLVAVRMLCPLSIESAFSLIPSTETISPEIMMDTTPIVTTGVAAIDEVVYPVIAQSSAPDPATSANPLQIWFAIAGFIWILGIAVMVLYTAVSYYLLHRKVVTAVKIRENLYQSENVESPFVLGIFRPHIYLPFCISEQNLSHVIAHEQAHICRRDHWWKPLGFLLLTVHWFNPLMWLSYALLCRDIELACDERVIKELGTEERANYSAALLSCSISRHMIAVCPVAFGEISVKTRVRSVLSYKKPAFWMILIALILCVALAVCFLTDPIGSSGEPDLSFLNYENAISAVADREEVQVIYYLQVTDEAESFIKLGKVSGGDLAHYLDNCRWREVNAPMDSLSSPGSIEFVIEDDYCITVYDRKEWSLRWYAKVSYGKEVRYYSTAASDYSDAVGLAYFSSDNFNDVTSFLATILEIQDGYYLVESTNSRLEQSSYDRFLVPIKNAYPSPEPSIGDIIEVMYKGQVPAGYPGKIPESCSIRVRFVQENGSLAHVVTEEGVAEIRVTTQTYSGGCVKADGSDFPVGDEVYIEEFSDFTDLTGATITALDKNGNILYAFSWPEEKYEAEVTETLPPDSDVDYVEKKSEDSLPSLSAVHTMYQQYFPNEIEQLQSMIDQYRDTVYGNGTGFEMNFAGNTSLQNHFALSEDTTYWQISVFNEGNGVIVMELEGEVYRIEAGTTEVFTSDEPWKSGTYSVSFATFDPSGMEGYVICKTASQEF